MRRLTLPWRTRCTSRPLGRCSCVGANGRRSDPKRLEDNRFDSVFPVLRLIPDA